jgi:hypothetical protein
MDKYKKEKWEYKIILLVKKGTAPISPRMKKTSIQRQFKAIKV